jgi:hypothetical protein
MTESESGKKDNQILYALSKVSRCHNCDQKLAPGTIVRLKNKDEDREVLCQSCANLGNFELVRAGNAKATRLLSKYSTSRYVVLKWSELWKTYERQGVFVESTVIDKLEKENDIKIRTK